MASMRQSTSGPAATFPRGRVPLSQAMPSRAMTSRVAEVEGHLCQPVGGPDGGEVDAKAGDGEAAVGAADGVHGERFGVAGQRLAASEAH